MKKSALIFGGLLLAIMSFNSISSYARCTTRHDHPDGTYDKVRENSAGTELDCAGKGNVECKYQDGTPGLIIFTNGNPVTEQQAGLFVESNINQGILSGTVTGDFGIGYYSWSFNPMNGLTFIFNDGNIQP
jgi:hypothetical protein